MTTTQPTPSDAVWTIPNVLTFFRLAMLPVYLWLGLDTPPKLGWAVVLGFLMVASDLADGAIARKTGAITKLGILLDPLADRLSFAAAIIVILVHELAWPWLVWIVLARDALLVIVGFIVLKLTHREIPPVTWLGKRASFFVTVGLGSMVIAGAVGTPQDPNDAVQIAAYVVLIPATIAYLFTAAGYVQTALKR